MDAAVGLGITTFDTADAYGGGRSETFIGEWLRTKPPEIRKRIVLSTKTFNPMEEGADRGLRPERIRRQLESSLTRLDVERVDMYLTHDQDPGTPIEDTLRALDELVRAGKVGAIGASNVDGAGLARARGVDTATLALAWLLAHPLVTAVVVGPRRPEHLEPASRALELHLGEDERAELARLFDP